MVLLLSSLWLFSCSTAQDVGTVLAWATPVDTGTIHGPEPKNPFLDDPDWEAVARNLDPRLGAGQLMIIALRPKTGTTLLSLDRETRDLVRQVQPGGVILYAYNLENRTQVRALVKEIEDLCVIRPFIAIDEEGGRVSRLKSTPGLGAFVAPPARRMALGGTEEVSRVYGILGRQLAALGITMNFAPVADLDFHPDEAYLGDRSFGADPLTVGHLASAAFHALEAQGVVAVAKHFPGHGRSREDSHYGLSVIDATREELELDLGPFRQLFAQGVPATMTAHVAYPAFGGELPASFEATILRDLARAELGYRGLLITDALDMAGATGLEAGGSLAVRALAAGADMVLSPLDPRGTARSIIDEISFEGGPAWYAEALGRVLETKHRYRLFRAPRVFVSDEESDRIFSGEPRS